MHHLAEVLHCTDDDILTAIAHGRRSIVDAKGKLAELFLFRHLSAEALLSEVNWLDKHNQPDFKIRVVRSPIIYTDYNIECKNVRSPNVGNPGPIKVELQKTRNSKNEKANRGYRHDQFHILAVCMFNRTGHWTFLFRATNTLPQASDAPGYLQKMITVSANDEFWRDHIIDAINDYEYARNQGVCSDQRVSDDSSRAKKAQSLDAHKRVRPDGQPSN